MRSLAVFLGVVVLESLMPGTSPAQSQGQQQQLLAAYGRGVQHQKRGEYRQAAAAFEQALELAPQVFGAENPNTATILNNLAAAYYFLGRLAEAEPLYERSLHIREQKLGASHADVAVSLNNLAELYQAMGQYARAEPLLERSLRIKEQALGKDHPDVAQGLNNLAGLLYSMGQYARAALLFERSLQIYQVTRGQDHPDVAQALNNLGLVYQAMGQADRAEPLYERSLHIREEKLGQDHPSVATTLNNLANVYQDMSRPERAEPLYRRCLHIREEQLGRDHPDVALTLNCLAGLYYSTGEYERAEPLLKRSLRICEARQGKDHPQTATSLNNLAILYHSVGDLDQAGQLGRRSLHIREQALGQDHPDVADSLSTLALFAAVQKDWQEAANHFDQDLRLLHRHIHRILPVLSEQEQLAFLAGSHQRDFHAALSLALLQGQDHAALREQSAVWLCNAKALTQQSLARRALLARQVAGPQTVDARRLLELRRQLAALTLALPRPGQEEQRRNRIQQLGRQEEQLARKLALVGGQHLLDAPWIDLEPLRRAIPADSVLVDIARFMVARFQARGKLPQWQPAHYAAWIVPAADRGPVQVIDLGPAQAIDQAVAALQQALRDAPGKIRRDGEPESEQALHAPLAALSKMVLHPLLRQIHSSSRWLLSPDGSLWLVPWSALLLPDGSYTVEKHSLHYLVSSRDLVPHAPPTGKPSAAQLFADPAFDAAPSETASPARGLGRDAPDLSGQTLAGAIEDWQVKLQLREDGRLFIRDAQDGRLAGEGTWQQEGGRLLMQTRISRFEGQLQGTTVSGSRRKREADGTISTDRWSARIPEQAAAPQSAVRAAESSELRLGRVGRLPGTAQEAALVAPRLQELTGSKPLVYTGAEASEGQLKAVERPQVLMLSTHGFFLPDQEVDPRNGREAGGGLSRSVVLRDREGKRVENPLLRCGLLLAGCNQRQQVRAAEEDGVLTGLEIVGLDLRGTELVVLSACETGLGQVRNGEGVAGLRQAFQLAGAHSVLASLWQVPDRETVLLMNGFFERLTQERDRADALAQAQRMLIRARRQHREAAHPYFWAAFTLTGQRGEASR